MGKSFKLGFKRGKNMVTGERITFTKNPEQFIENAIAKFVQNRATNHRKVDGGRYWDSPLAGFASGDDADPFFYLLTNERIFRPCHPEKKLIER
jgi:hypothetical protein